MRHLDFMKFFGLSIASVAVFSFVTGADAASYSGRSAYERMTGSPVVSRMPTMPSLPGMAVGNISQDVPTTPFVPSEPNEPDEPDTPSADCPDGEIKNSGYTIEACMTDMLRCVNGGGMPGGLNDLFDDNVRESVAVGMGVCAAQVDKCISDVRVDCKYIYDNAGDVWADFNSRRVQPAYYDFVLRKTGLSPYQAEYTCRMLDNDQGEQYAYWDAVNGACMVRVAAFNKDEQIKNSWLFGAAGDDTLAQVWRATGETFTCNKDLFGFSLMNDTNTAAVVGIGGGTLLGAGIGAAVGSGNGARVRIACVTEYGKDFLTCLNENSATEKYPVIQHCIDESASSDLECQRILESKGTVKEDLVAVFCPSVATWADCANALISPFDICKDASVTSAEQCEQLVKQQLSGAGRGKATAIGAATGAGVGGLATAITAFVEKNNINCRVGNGLNTVSYGKSYTIPTLRDLYLKFGLQLPDVVSPGANIAGCDAWVNACAEYLDLNMCRFAQFNYKSSDGVVAQSVPAACVVSDGVCIENYPVTKSYGVCE